MKDWHKLKPEMSKKQPFYRPGCDTQPVCLIMLVLRDVSSMNARWGRKFFVKGWRPLTQKVRFRAASGRACSAASSVLFLRQAGAMQPIANARHGNSDSMLSVKRLCQTFLCQVGFSFHTRPVVVGAKFAPPVIALGLGFKCPGGAVPLDHLSDEFNRHIKPRRRRIMKSSLSVA